MFLLLLITNALFLVIAIQIDSSLVLALILAFLFTLIETIIIVALTMNFNELMGFVGKSNSRISRFENLNHPLLIKLSNQAPGTYNHSLNVAQLVIMAAKSIDLDPGYLRVGAYFHDIGKLKNPKIFIENKGGEIKDCDLSKISLDIIDHVALGQKLAREYSLPEEAIEYIGQHHGSSDIYLLRERLEKSHLNSSYPGPKPLSKSAAILMLADSIEASIRSMKTLSDEKIDRAVENEYEKKIKDGQLDLSGLNRAELDKTKRSFKATMRAIYHQRKIK